MEQVTLVAISRSSTLFTAGGFFKLKLVDSKSSLKALFDSFSHQYVYILILIYRNNLIHCRGIQKSYHVAKHDWYQHEKRKNIGTMVPSCQALRPSERSGCPLQTNPPPSRCDGSWCGYPRRQSCSGSHTRAPWHAPRHH